MIPVHFCHDIDRWTLCSCTSERYANIIHSKRITRKEYKLIKEWYAIPHDNVDEFDINFDDYYEKLEKLNKIQKIIERVFLYNDQENLAIFHSIMYELAKARRGPTEKEWKMMQDKIYKEIENMFLPMIIQDTTEKFISCKEKYLKRKSKLKEINLQIEKMNPSQKDKYCSDIKEIMHTLKIGKKYHSNIKSIIAKCKSENITRLIDDSYLWPDLHSQRDIDKQKRWVEGEKLSWMGIHKRRKKIEKKRLKKRKKTSLIFKKS